MRSWYDTDQSKLTMVRHVFLPSPLATIPGNATMPEICDVTLDCLCAPIAHDRSLLFVCVCVTFIAAPWFPLHTAK